ncbi:hypothetical protein PaG_02591 [Moesziomyces aphidis]|uniref:RNA polymerase II-associated protein 3 n=1 Tax=Moesziomyces aphidis TaxID=84754 RepID=W3VPZ2_MOEAP|nr:hypothetical protein PaG_02591 [Moesziomyces aphidis]
MGRSTDKAKALAEKQKGNDAFAKKQWAEAIGFYSAARLADASEPTIPLNRAMAYLKLSKFLDAERDCTTALELSPNNVKALYRRATARMGADKFEAAREDYNSVLRLDAGNAEAKAGLAKANEALERAKKRRTEPIDLPTVAPEGSSANSAAHANGFDLGPANGGTAQIDSNSSVEAARKFLQQVGMSDDPEEQDSGSKLASSAGNVPSKFPGETGGLLREVTTRRTPNPATAKQDTQRASSSATTVAAPTSSSGSVSQKTASALSFGAGPSQRPARVTQPQTLSASTSNPGKLSAIEFQRRWKNKSERLQLLSSLDIDSIPGMIDAMLEPELVAEVLETLAQGHRSSPQDGELQRTAADVLTVLPRCKRFGMTVAMLDESEKAHAAYLVDAVGRSDLKSVWELN